MSWLANAFIKS